MKQSINLLKVVYMGIVPMLCALVWIMLYKFDKLNDGGNVFLMSFLTFLSLYVGWAVWFIFNPEKK